MIQLPHNVTFHNWFMDLNRSMPSLVVPTPSPGSKDWRKWAMLLISVNKNTLSNVVLPLIEQFPDEESWRKWAQFFIQNTAT
jgi:hypothetical protein